MGWLCYPVWSIVGVTTFRWNSFYLVPVPPSLLSFDPNCSVLFQFIRSFCIATYQEASGLQNKMVNQKKLTTTTMTLSRLQKDVWQSVSLASSGKKMCYDRCPHLPATFTTSQPWLLFWQSVGRFLYRSPAFRGWWKDEMKNEYSWNEDVHIFNACSAWKWSKLKCWYRGTGKLLRGLWNNIP